MLAKRWGVFLCDCRSTLNMDLQKIGNPASLVVVATNPEKDIEDFASKADQLELEHVVVGCCAKPSIFEEALQGKTLHFLDLKGKCFAPHSNIEQAHTKASKMIEAEIRVSNIKAKNPVPVNPLQVGNRVVIFTEFSEGLKLASMLDELMDGDSAAVTLCISSDIEGLEDGSPLLEQRTSLIAVEGRLGNLKITLEPDQILNGGSQKRFDLKADQLIVLTKTHPPGIKRRTGVHLLSSTESEILEETVRQVRDLVGHFHKPVHLTYDQDICAGGDKGMETCGRCISYCPYDAISRQTENRLRIQVDHLTCEGCGACVSACPTSALQFTEPSPQEIYARMAALLESSKEKQGNVEPPVIVFHCEEMGRKVLETAGLVPLPYSPGVLPVEVPCLRYVSESNMLAAMSLGAAGVGLLGCEDCPNGERELLYQKYDFTQLILQNFDLDQDRVRIITAEAGQEADAVEAINQFVSQLSESPMVPNWTTPSQTLNRPILSDVLGGFIDQTGNEPGRISLSSELPFAFANINESGCTLCRSCANVCPTNAFRFEEESNSLHFKHINCVGCGLCEEVCPENVITIKRELVLEKQSLDYTLVAEDEMINCLKCEKPYINRRALEAVESKLFEIESLKNTFSGNRKNILRMCPDCRTVAAMMEVDRGWEP
ncbi:MAG: methyl-viologen-reducing hydrogenase subunit delta [SAR324 cluster bacterium]|uniref:Methyl-viologen-reducing hydrogenase subunit delta n=1 Tax=SAR324 cluster bacterium TaxID=2024889 RepID=A0A432GQK8_9DELT|nr:MAG: methyl-viologen-reducing hydrogenase subunit delta [SAR324 cluster bacterium]